MSFMKDISVYAVPLVFIAILSIGMYRNVRVYDQFAEGAKDGITTTVRIIPPLVGLMVAVAVFRASGALDLILFALRPVTNLLGIPPDALTLAFLRPVSGSASMALVSDIMKEHGPDSFTGRLACTMMGSTETIFYTLTVYFGAMGIKKIRYALGAALIADIAGMIASLLICRMLFGNP